ncbi:MAG: glycine oxidase ThiO [Acidimicrobiales bacterium]
MAPDPSDDLLVVGAGVIGLSIAWRSAVAGLTVTLVDPAPGRGATWAAAGMLAPVSEAHFGEEELVALNLAAARDWPTFASELEAASGRSVHYTPLGMLLVAADPSDRDATDRLLRFQHALELRARRLSAAECRAAEPLLAAGVCGGAELGEDHQVDNRALAVALEVACEASGVSMIRDEVSGLCVEYGRLTGVSLRSGEQRSAHSVVLCAGCRSGELPGLPEDLRPPVRPVKGLTLRLGAGDSPRLRRTVRGLVHGRSCYLVPRADGTLVVGATVEEKGFDLSVQAGAVLELLDSARRIVPVVDEYELLETTTGLRPGSPDNGPLVGETPIAGLLVATGHYRHGILLAPLTAERILELLAGADRSERLDALFAPFSPDRFGDRERVRRSPVSMAGEKTEGVR